MKKELQRKEKLLESQKTEISKMTKYLGALTEVRQLREKAKWKAGMGSVYMVLKHDRFGGWHNTRIRTFSILMNPCQKIVA